MLLVLVSVRVRRVDGSDEVDAPEFVGVDGWSPLLCVMLKMLLVRLSIFLLIGTAIESFREAKREGDGCTSSSSSWSLRSSCSCCSMLLSPFYPAANV